MPTWDELDGVSWDVLYTYDDPLRNYRLNTAYALGTVTREGPNVAVDWSGGGFIIDTLDAPFAKDRFIRTWPIVITDAYGRTVVDGMGNADTGQTYTLTGTAADFDVASGVATHTQSAVNSFRSMKLPAGASDQDVYVDVMVPIANATGERVSHWVAVRLTDDNNHYVIRLEVTPDSPSQMRLGMLKRVAGVLSGIGTAATLALTHTAGEWWRMRVRIYGTRLQGKAWRRDVDTEPFVWQAEVDDSSLATGTQMGLFSRIETGNTNTLPIVFSWKNLSVATNASWPSTDFGNVWTLSDSTRFSNDGTKGVVTVTAVNTMYSAIMAGVVNNDYDIMAKVRVPVLALTDKISVYLFTRYQDANNHWRYRFDFNIDQVIGWGIEQVVGGVVTQLWAGLIPLATHTTADSYWIRAQGAGPDIRHKIWKDGQPQPDDPLILGVTDTTYNGFPGAIGLGVLVGPANTNPLPVTVEIGQFWSGVNELLDNGNASVIKSLDDGMPQGATDTTNLGIGEASAALTSPIGSRASVYWSTFRTDQPYSDIDRDVPGVGISSGAVTSDGVRSVRMFTGQMADVVVTDEDVTMKAVSRNRLRMSTPVQPPAVHGYFEGGEATWVIGYALFKAGLYAAPPPIPGCRFYQPMSGTLHPYIPDTNYKAFVAGMVVYHNPSLQVYETPSFVDGPFPGTAAPDVRLDATAARRIDGLVGNTALAPGDDFWSQAGACGRIEFWIRGDPVDVAGSMNPTESVVARVLMFNPGVTRYVQVGVGTATRCPSISVNDGVNGLLGTHTTPVPTDGKWHFVAGSWDIPNNSLQIALDGVTVAFLSSPLSTANLPARDDVQSPACSSNVPISEIRVTSGPLASHKKSAWVRDSPWSPDVVLRRSFLTAPGFAETTPVEAYALISKYAQGELARTGFDDQDRFNYLPLSYFGEAAQQLVVEDLSTATNLGRDFKPVREVNRTYNYVTVKYKQTEVQELFVKVYESSSLITLNPGTTLVQLSTNKPAIEIRDVTNAFSVFDGATLAAFPSGAMDFNAINYVTANTVLDGSGTYATSANMIVTVAAWDPGSVTVSFQNISGSIMYVVNNVNLPPLAIAAKVLTIVDASVTAQNSASVAQRGPRLLDASMPGIANAIDAARVAQELTARLGFPRTTFTSTAFGDPRRTPTQLVNVADPDKTNLSGTFRITGVSNTQRAEDLDQRVSGEQAWPVFVWGVSNWGEAVWGED